jgi:hypothetical protein
MTEPVSRLFLIGFRLIKNQEQSKGRQSRNGVNLITGKKITGDLLAIVCAVVAPPWQDHQ